jgi:DNA-binding Xre family transcriptional regulator
MLYFKIKELMLYCGIKSPQRFLMKAFGYRHSKAYNLVDNRTRTISLDDLSEICQLMNCTPNDLLYWDNSKKYKMKADHPLIVNLSPPPKNVEWKEVHHQLPIEGNLRLREFAENLIKEYQNKK